MDIGVEERRVAIEAIATLVKIKHIMADLIECRWREKLADIRQLDGLKGQIDRSGKQTMGVFLSINGWSENVCPLLKQNPEKSIILMDGYDLRGVLFGQADLRDFLLAKIAKLNLESEPFLGLPQYLKEQQDE